MKVWVVYSDFKGGIEQVCSTKEKAVKCAADLARHYIPIIHGEEAEDSLAYVGFDSVESWIEDGNGIDGIVSIDTWVVD